MRVRKLLQKLPLMKHRRSRAFILYLDAYVPSRMKICTYSKEASIEFYSSAIVSPTKHVVGIRITERSTAMRTRLLLCSAVCVVSLMLLEGVSSAETKQPNGVPCKNDSQCTSNYCSAKLKGFEGPFGQGLCMDSNKNCAIPGGDGIAYEGEYNFGGNHWYCTRGVGLQNDGKARNPNYYYGGSCSGFWEKIDCHGDWLPKIWPFLQTACAASAVDPTLVSGAFCTGAELSKKEYDKQTGR